MTQSFRPHPPRADGERDGELVNAAIEPSEGPIQLAWMVNKIRLRSLKNGSISFTIQTSWMGSQMSSVSQLAAHLFHHPGELDGVDGTLLLESTQASTLCTGS